MNEFMLSLVFGFMFAGIFMGFVFALENGWRGLIGYCLRLTLAFGAMYLTFQAVGFLSDKVNQDIVCAQVKHALETGQTVADDILSSPYVRRCGVDITPLLDRHS